MPIAKQRIAEHDVVALKRRIRGWPAGTTGTAVIDHGSSKLVEISDDQGQMLDLFEVAEGDLELVVRCSSDPGTEEAVATVGQDIGEIDVVSFKEPVGKWPAGTTGTVVSDYGSDKMVEISNELGEGLDFPVVHASKLELVAKYS